jgi:hypothetical protein
MTRVSFPLDGNVVLSLNFTDDMLKQALGMSKRQIDMLRAIIEDHIGIDPATLNVEEMNDQLPNLLANPPK